MSNPNPFGAPSFPGFPGAAAAAAPANPFAGAAAPPPAAAPIDAATALRGLNEADIETRYPRALPNKDNPGPDQQYIVKIEAVKMFNARKGGLTFIVEGEVMQSTCAERPQGSKIAGPNINGFQNPDAVKFAFSDLKQLMIAACHKYGLQAEMPAGFDWIDAALKMVRDNLAAGVFIGMQTTIVDTKGGFKKAKGIYYPLQQPA